MGLRLQVEGTGLCASNVSARRTYRDSGLRWAIRTSRQLRTRYYATLRVIITPAVYRSFVRLKPDFGYLHWQIQRLYTTFRSSSRLCFIKQSGPGHCDQLFRAGTFSRSYRAILPSSSRYFARHTLGCSPWVPVSVLGTVISAAFMGPRPHLRFRRFAIFSP